MFGREFCSPNKRQSCPLCTCALMQGDAIRLLQGHVEHHGHHRHRHLPPHYLHTDLCQRRGAQAAQGRDHSTEKCQLLAGLRSHLPTCRLEITNKGYLGGWGICSVVQKITSRSISLETWFSGCEDYKGLRAIENMHNSVTGLYRKTCYCLHTELGNWSVQ